jgi:DNA-cytosine methyltransferase
MNGINVLSLFDGMSCGQIALERAGIKVNQYYASEIDKYAIQVTQTNFPNTIQLGDVTKVNAASLPKIDLVIGGSPCQGFSLIGKQLNFQDPRSLLFFEYLRIWNEVRTINQSAQFILENVCMKEEYEKVISKYMEVNPILINSSLLSAQNRERLYWTNIGLAPKGLFGELESIIDQPKEKGFLLKHVLESEVDEKYYLSDKMLNYLNTRKANFNSGKINYKFGEEKAACLNASSGHLDISDNIVVIRDIQKGVVNDNGTLRSIAKDLAIDANYHKGMDNHAQRTMVQEGDRIRRLTPIECERLQTVPDNYTSSVSNTQRYRMIGNGWTVDVIAYILSFSKFA